jgi:hypothetical protein
MKYVLEWSRKSNGFHIQPIETTLAKNQECFLENRSHDYILLMVGTHDVCCTMAENHRGKLENRTKSSSVTMTGKTLRKLTTEERNNLIDQIGSIELIG